MTRLKILIMQKKLSGFKTTFDSSEANARNQEFKKQLVLLKKLNFESI